MLVICNGVPKSGTTWVTMILKKQSHWIKPIPSAYHNPEWDIFPSLRPEYLFCIDKLDFYNNDHYVSKNHISTTHLNHAGIPYSFATTLLNHPSIRVINSIRDFLDQFVSWYFHDRARNNIPEDASFSWYYEKRRESRMRYLMDYNKLWYTVSDRSPITVAYEHLKTDFDGALAQLQQDLTLPEGLAFDAVELGERTSLDRLKCETEHELFRKLFRKGETGDHLNHMTDRQIAEMKTALIEAGYPQIKSTIARRHPHLEPLLRQTDVGLG